MSQDWTIAVWESGNTYGTADNFYRPNENLETKRQSNLQVIKLVDGSEAFIFPEIKFLKETTNMFFANTTSAFRTLIEDYITHGDKVKITTHTGETIIGYFIDMARVWLVGVSPDAYDISVTLKQTE